MSDDKKLDWLLSYRNVYTSWEYRAKPITK